ncbi:Vacuolar protein-sorting-associated protein 36 [Lucilia cuprina]|uniref:Vacuolar protein-sorting-associated protein 36 n=1 Tax=Lucilia cuprina TaxID=7375 RepID=A0A0L0CIA9_LUCCU|nr:Vacuolar protein-sorting-associated protein 36 [Lucilia cuprina]KNC31980.1 Vacuolar protein-sorting-associated protein 36 [Lucilia cuprina]
MNRFEYMEARLYENEAFVSKESQIKLYDGDQKTQFEEGDLVLTSHRLFWGRPGDIAKAAVCLCLNLKYVISVSEEQASNFLFGRKTRLILHLRQPTSDKLPGPLDNSTNAFIKLSGKHGVLPEFSNALRETLQAKLWDVKISSSDDVVNQKKEDNYQDNITRETRLRMRTGIGGIERAIEQKTKETDENIALAFQDLRVLMGMAKDMVSISRVISDKIRSQRGEISNDETVRFKSYLLSLGIEDPVTREGFSNESEYFKSLAEQLCIMLLDPLEESGGMMSLADVYCRVNRARGLELLSPEDLLNACRLLKGPIKLRSFPSGAMVLQLESQDDELTASETFDLVQKSKSLAVEELAKLCNISLLLAKERLLAAERHGKLCRDQSLEGLRFYPNLILNTTLV